MLITKTQVVDVNELFFGGSCRFFYLGCLDYDPQNLASKIQKTKLTKPAPGDSWAMFKNMATRLGVGKMNSEKPWKRKSFSASARLLRCWRQKCTG